MAVYKPNGKLGNDLYHVKPSMKDIMMRFAKFGNERDRKRADLVVERHEQLLKSFEIISKIVMKFKMLLIRQRALRIVSSGYSTRSAIIEGCSDVHISFKITPRWIQELRQSKGVVCHEKGVKLSLSTAKQQLVEREVNNHLGTLFRYFSSGVLHEYNVFN